MSCCGHKKTVPGEIDAPGQIKPDSPCALCGDKHLSTAYALSRETGYADSLTYRKRMSGELVLAAWHVHALDKNLAEMLRQMRHDIQTGKLEQVDWIPSLAAMDALVKSA